MKPIVSLLDSVGLQLIVEYPSGVLYSNQSGGTTCLHPEVEGVLVPLRNDTTYPENELLSPEIDLLRFFEGPPHKGTGATYGLDLADAEFIDSVLDKVSLGGVVAVDRQRLRDSYEAWVHVQVLGEEDLPHGVNVFRGFGPYPRAGILTWANSD